MAEFDAKAAKAAGYSDEEIAKIQSGITAARAAGYSDEEITAHLSGQAPGAGAKASSPDTPAPPTTYDSAAAPPPSSGAGRLLQPLRTGVPAPAQNAPVQQQTGVHRALDFVGSNLAQGLATGLGVLGDLEQLGNQVLPNFLTRPYGSPPGTPPHQFFPTSKDTVGLTDKLGLTNRPDLQPSGPVETYGGAALRGVGAGVPMLATGGAALPLLGSSAVGGLAGEAAHQALPDSTVAPVVAGLAGGLGAGGLASSLARGSVAKIADSLGSSETFQQAGEQMRSMGKAWVSDLPNKVAPLWAPIDAGVPTTAKVGLSGVNQRLNDMNKQAGAAQGAVDLLTSKLPQQIKGALVNTAGNTLRTLSWANTQQLRSAVGEAMSDPQVLRSIPQAKLASLYQALSEAMRSTAGKYGLTDAFNEANAQSAKLYDFASGTLGKVLDTTRTPESVAKSLLSAGKTGGTDLAALREHLPDAADELAAAHLRQPQLGWDKLSPEAKANLVPDPGTRNTLDQAATASKASSKKDLGHSMLGAMAGPEVGALALNALGLPGSDIMHMAAGGTVGTFAPMLYRGAKGLAMNPSGLRLPLAGGVGGTAAGGGRLP